LPQAVVASSGQSLLNAPTAEDLASDELRPDLERYLAGGPEAPADRARLFRLAWDLACGPFASRQLLFELFNGRDLPRNRLAFLQGYDLSPFEAMARRLAGIGPEDNRREERG
jgi:4-hydroxyphenylacetate 3-monooxygenase/anthranilate 3-monooxygenase (FAD)/4-hydroxyphenylacetate 3-monooxygenase